MAIYAVVMGHVMVYGAKGLNQAWLMTVIGLTHMPLFFFISGWFSCRMDAATGLLRAPSLWRRFLQLMVPMAVVPVLWVWYLPHSGLNGAFNGGLERLWLSPMKFGYWFTLCLFEISVVFAAVFPLLRRRNTALTVTAAVAVWAALTAASLLLPQKVTDAMGLTGVSMYWVPFMTGFIAAQHRRGFARMTASGGWVTAAIVVCAACLFMYSWPARFEPYNRFALPLMHVSLAVAIIAVVKPWAERAFSPEASPTARTAAVVWAVLGRNSLAIYLLHYFLLFPVGAIAGPLAAMHRQFVPMAIFAFVAAGCIIAITLLVNAVIRRSPLLALLLTGTVPAKRSKRESGAVE